MRGYEDLQKGLHSEINGHIQRNRELNRSGEEQKPQQTDSSSQDGKESTNTQKTNGTMTEDNNGTELSESLDSGPQSPTTRVNPRTLNVKYVADSSSMPVETEASTANNDPLNLVSFDGDISVRSTSQMSSRDDSNTKPEAMQPPYLASEMYLRRDYKDDLDSPSDLPVANNIHLLTHPLQAAMATASPAILSQATLVMGHGQFADFPSNTPPLILESDTATKQTQDIPDINIKSETKTVSPDAQPTTTKSGFSQLISTNDDGDFTRDPLGVLGSGDRETASLVNGTIESGNQSNTETDKMSESASKKDGTYKTNLYLCSHFPTILSFFLFFLNIFVHFNVEH